jgi:hypothetical protein
MLLQVYRNLYTKDIIVHKKESIYKPRQKDSLFWCFYILKNGFSNYEMEIINQYFVVEKTEKFRYVELIRKNKDILKIHKIKPLTELEDDLANKDKISIKTFFALCVLENINILLVDKRKIFELTFTDIDDKIITRSQETGESIARLTHRTLVTYPRRSLRLHDRQAEGTASDHRIEHPTDSTGDPCFLHVLEQHGVALSCRRLRVTETLTHRHQI